MIKGLAPGVSVLATLAEIKDFVRHCNKDERLLGFNMMVSKHPGRSYIMGKTNDSLQAKYVLPIPMDCMDPVQRPLIANAIHEGIHHKSMTAEAMENEMVSKAD